MSENGECQVCGAMTQNRCEECQTVFYCSQEHQQFGHPYHVTSCKPYTVFNAEQSASYVIANRKLQEGELILQEKPLVIGPSQTRRVCLACLMFLDANSAPTHCRKCRWPLCNATCQNNPNHYPECYYLSNYNNDHVEYDDVSAPLIHRCIMILRCLYQKSYFPDVWEKLIKLESHYEERKSLPNYETTKAEILTIFQTYFDIKADYSEEEIMKMWAICLTNEVAAPIALPHGTAIYEISSQIGHDCIANCNRSIDSRGILYITAGINVSQGQSLTLCYTNPFWATHQRQLDLQQKRFLNCLCKRCLDVSELGTNLSAVKCPNQFCGGTVLPETFLTQCQQWSCALCSRVVPYDTIYVLLMNAREALQCLERNNEVQVLKIFLKMSKRVLSNHHSFLILLEICLLPLLGGTTKPFMHEISNEILEMKTDLCQQLVSLLESISPAERKIHGFVNYHLYLCLHENYRRKRLSDDLRNKKIFLCLLKKSSDYLKYESTYTKETVVVPDVLQRIQRLEEEIIQIRYLISQYS